MSIEENLILRLKIPHQVGQLARIVTTIGKAGGLIGEIVTLRRGEDFTIRDITVEGMSQDHLQKVSDAVRELEGIEVQRAVDRTFARHEGGKIESVSRVELRQVSDLREIYTPGVARVCRAITENPALANRYTGIGNTVAIITNGTRVLGLGDIGPLAAMPVMEGKAVLYHRFVGISAIPILIDSRDPEEFIRTVIQISPTFGAIHLEDIRVPDCYLIESRLDEKLKIPVMHDDRHGTGVVALAAIFNAARRIDRDLSDVTVGQIGLGAAGSGIAHLAVQAGINVRGFDPNPLAVDMLVEQGGKGASIDEIFDHCDIVVAATGKPGLIPVEKIRPGQIIFALSNPVPEIEPAAALAAGAAYAYDGRSVNNYLGFPGLFRGALIAKSQEISWEMKLAAAKTIARCAAPGELIPDPLDEAVHKAVTNAVAWQAQAQGLAGTTRIRAVDIQARRAQAESDPD
jgi:malate dehydrogenase (oxaloacetate-decarboxylating)